MEPRVLGVTKQESILAKWYDNNESMEDRKGYFVTLKEDNDQAKIIKKASNLSEVLGVTVPCGGLSSEYSYVSFVGVVTVLDDGTCTVNGKCTTSSNGIATKCSDGTGYKVLERLDSSHISILLSLGSRINMNMSVDGTTLILTNI